MNRLRVIVRSLSWYRATSAAVVAGFAIAAMVIAGSLVVGDSVRAGLRARAVQRLGRIDVALAAPNTFDAGLADRIRTAGGGEGPIAEIAAALQAAGSVRAGDTSLPNAALIGIDGRFFSLFSGEPSDMPEGRNVSVGRSLANELNLTAGDVLIATAPKILEGRSDTLFGRRDLTGTMQSLRLIVSAIVDDAHGGAYDLRGDAATARNVFIDIEFLAEQLGASGRANVLLVRLATPGDEAAIDACARLLKQSLTLDDLNLRLATSATTGALYLQSGGLLITDAQSDAAQWTASQIGATADRTSVYIASTIRRPGAEPSSIAYAIVASLDRPELLLERPDSPDEIAPESIWLNRWAATDLKAETGDRVEVEWLVPKPDGSYATVAETFAVEHIVELAGPSADKALTPTVRGITEAERIDQWDPPFPVDMERVTDRDEAYWERHRATPRAFVAPEVMQRVWQRATQHAGPGWVTGVRIEAPAGADAGAFESEFAAAFLNAYDPADAGMAFGAVRRQAFDAAQGTTDFASLFLGLGAFVFIAGFALAAMLIRLNADRRASQTGLMLACGLTPRCVRGFLIAESMLLAVVGTAIGIVGGVGYAALIAIALSTWWRDAVGAAPVILDVRPAALAIGATASLAGALAAVFWSVRRQGRSRVVDLLRGGQHESLRPSVRSGRLAAALTAAAGAAALASFALALAGAVPDVAAFFIGGALLLAAALLGQHLLLIRLMRHRAKRLTSAAIALRSAASNRGRSLLVSGLMAAAAFVIVAVAVNSRDYSSIDVRDRHGPAGGFSLLARMSAPVPLDFTAEAGRDGLGFSPGDGELFEGVIAYGLLVSDGQDASCLNLARPVAPRIVGVPDALRRANPFTVTTARAPAGGNPWNALLDESAGGAIAVFIDAETAAWQFHVGLGDTLEISDIHGRPVTVRVAGLIGMGILAGEVLMAEEHFRRLFPAQAAPRMFLIETLPGQSAAVADALRRNLADYGIDAVLTTELLNRLIAVQNTYLSTFLSLGGLGLALGSFGLIVVLWRNVLERRGEFALMLATGFSRRRIAGLLIGEHAGLFLVGLLVGTGAALAATAPHLASAQAAIAWHIPVLLLVCIIVLGLALCWAASALLIRGRLIESLRHE